MSCLFLWESGLGSLVIGRTSPRKVELGEVGDGNQSGFPSFRGWSPHCSVTVEGWEEGGKKAMASWRRCAF